MNAPFIWIVLPVLFALGLAFWPARRGRYPLGLAATLAWALTAAFLPIDQVITLGQWRFKIDPRLPFLGRHLTLTDAHRPLLWLSFGLLALWLLSARLTLPQDRTGDYFPALAIGIQGIWLGALTIQPALYAAVLIQVAVLGTTFYLSQYAPSPARGLQRYLILQTLAMPLLLLASWLLTGVEAAPADLALTRQALVFLSAGLLLLLPAFPFHVWAPQLADETPPFLLAFWLALFPSGTLLFGLRFLENYVWLRENQALSQLLGTIGLLTVLIAGLLAAWQRSASRLLAYAGLALNGVTLLAIAASPALNLYILPRHLALLALGYGLQRLTLASGGADYRQLQAAAYHRPQAATLSALGLLTLSGLPLFALFPLYYNTWAYLLAQGRWQGLLFGLGLVGLTIGALRLLAVLLHAREPRPWQSEADLRQRAWGLLLLLGLLLPTLWPQWLRLANGALSRMFPHLLP